MAKESERTFQMKRNFIKLHDKGYGIPEIAKIYKLSVTTVYNALEEIAYNNGRTREELLKVVRSKRSERIWKQQSRAVHTNTEELRGEIRETTDRLEKLLDRVGRILEEEHNETDNDR